jgi:hypothetical protein
MALFGEHAMHPLRARGTTTTSGRTSPRARQTLRTFVSSCQIFKHARGAMSSAVEGGRGRMLSQGNFRPPSLSIQTAPPRSMANGVTCKNNVTVAAQSVDARNEAPGGGGARRASAKAVRL